MTPESSTLPEKETGADPDPEAGEESTPAQAEKPVLRKGARIHLGYRKGTVDTIRGGWKKPYDIRVVWDGEKYPQWLLFTTVELDIARGDLKILD
jgi:hypothetical protein